MILVSFIEAVRQLEEGNRVFSNSDGNEVELTIDHDEGEALCWVGKNVENPYYIGTDDINSTDYEIREPANVS